MIEHLKTLLDAQSLGLPIYCGFIPQETTGTRAAIRRISQDNYEYLESESGDVGSNIEITVMAETAAVAESKARAIESYLVDYYSGPRTMGDLTLKAAHRTDLSDEVDDPIDASEANDFTSRAVVLLQHTKE